VSADAAPERYQFKIVLRHVSPMVWRRVVVPSVLTLADLHEVIQVAMGWDDEHLHRFHVHGRDHALSEPPSGVHWSHRRPRLAGRYWAAHATLDWARNGPSWTQPLGFTTRRGAAGKEPGAMARARWLRCPHQLAVDTGGRWLDGGRRDRRAGVVRCGATLTWTTFVGLATAGRQRYTAWWSTLSAVHRS